MISEIPWPFLVDIHDVALASELWLRNRFERPYEVTFERESRPGLILTETMAGRQEVDRFLSEFVYTPAIVETLAKRPILRNAADEFWDYIESGGFTGEFWSLNDGDRFQNHEPYASLRGAAGHVILFVSGTRTIFDQFIGLATEAQSYRDILPPKTRLVDGGSQRSFGHGWSLWDAEAARIGGKRAIDLVPQGVIGVIPESGMQGSQDDLSS